MQDIIRMSGSQRGGCECPGRGERRWQLRAWSRVSPTASCRCRAGWVLALAFAFPALEASAFAGFVFPGEIAVILGGVAASRGTVPLWAVIAAAVAGAIIGDSAGYLIGRRWGTDLLHGTLGRLPVIRRA